MKVCATCEKNLDDKQFSRCNKNKDGLQNSCKKCNHEYYLARKELMVGYRRQYYQENKNKLIKYAHKQYKNNKEYYQNYYRKKVENEILLEDNILVTGSRI